jgi:two-component system, OmpR family, response regulator ResD
MKTILIVDDEAKIRNVITAYLKNDGYKTIEAATGNEALTIIKSNPVDLVVLDLMLPDIPGEEVCVQIRKLSPVPILMLTAKAAEENRVKGLSLGADDYVLKPFSAKELLARIKSILRRSSPYELLSERVSYNDDQLIVDAVKDQVISQGVPVNLTPNELKLFLFLVRHPQRPFSREELVEKIFGLDYEGDIRTVDQHIKNIRQKIEPDSKSPTYILTVFGKGYKFAGGK